MTKITAKPGLEQWSGRRSPAEVRALAEAAMALGAGKAGGLPPVRSLYIHMPFCSHKCHYCDFYSIVDTRDRQEAFADRLVRELRAWAPMAAGGPLKTIFVGGGTPSLLRTDLWTRVLAVLGASYDLSEIRSGRGEFTVECNPESVTPELLDVLVAGGVNRVSMGAQSFDRRHLATLERRHNPENVARAHKAVTAAGIRRTSIDLIYAVPGQTPADFDADLSAAIALGTEHVSCYNLTYEPATAMTARLKRGDFTPADEDTEIEMFALAARRLRAAGLARYEISNYARPGAECRHNLAYWRQDSWIACGPSGACHLPLAGGSHRFKNTPRLDDYLEGDDAGFAPADDHEGPDARRALVERIMTGLRLAEGIDAGDTLVRAGAIEPGAAARLEARARHALDLGHLDSGAFESGRWVLTEAGVLVSNGVARTFGRALG
jgi:oxygen-independent coproporphyrinogen-3 oxidase